MIAINLVDESVLLLRRRSRHIRRWVLAVLGAAVLGVFPVGVEYSRNRRLQSLEGEQEEIVLSTQTVRATLNELDTDIRTLETQVSRADALRAKRSWSGLLGLVSDTLPDAVWLVSLATDPAIAPSGERNFIPKEDKTPGDKEKPSRTVVTLEAPRALNLQGFALEHRYLYEFMTKLKATNAFSEVTLTRLAEQPVLGGNAVRFDILCRW
jgi:Tfp pilus assembly protein PilN